MKNGSESMTPEEWLETHAPCSLQVQRVKPNQRRKNRVILTWHPRPGEPRTVGGPTVRGAIFRASVRDLLAGGPADTGTQSVADVPATSPRGAVAQQSISESEDQPS